MLFVCIHIFKCVLFISVLWTVVNNAGIAIFTEIEWCSVQQFQRIFDVNVIGLVRVTKTFLPLVRNVKGRIVNVASLAGQYLVIHLSLYFSLSISLFLPHTHAHTHTHARTYTRTRAHARTHTHTHTDLMAVTELITQGLKSPMFRSLQNTRSLFSVLLVCRKWI